MKEIILLVDETTEKNRLAACNRCQYYIHLMKLCKKCGCIMPLKAKLKDVNCPADNW